MQMLTRDEVLDDLLDRLGLEYERGRDWIRLVWPDLAAADLLPARLDDFGLVDHQHPVTLAATAHLANLAADAPDASSAPIDLAQLGMSEIAIGRLAERAKVYDEDDWPERSEVLSAQLIDDRLAVVLGVLERARDQSHLFAELRAQLTDGAYPLSAEAFDEILNSPTLMTHAAYDIFLELPRAAHDQSTTGRTTAQE